MALVDLELGSQFLKLEQVGDLAGQLDLLVGPQQPDPADLLEIDPDRVFGVDPLGTISMPQRTSSWPLSTSRM